MPATREAVRSTARLPGANRHLAAAVAMLVWTAATLVVPTRFGALAAWSRPYLILAIALLAARTVLDAAGHRARVSRSWPRIRGAGLGTAAIAVRSPGRQPSPQPTTVAAVNPGGQAAT